MPAAGGYVVGEHLTDFENPVTVFVAEPNDLMTVSHIEVVLVERQAMGSTKTGGYYYGFVGYSVFVAVG